MQYPLPLNPVSMNSVHQDIEPNSPKALKMNSVRKLSPLPAYTLKVYFVCILHTLNEYASYIHCIYCIYIQHIRHKMSMRILWIEVAA